MDKCSRGSGAWSVLATRSCSRAATKQSGFTLLELTIAICVLLIGVLGFSNAFVSMGRAEQKTRESTLAVLAARRVLASIQAEAFPEAFRRYNAAGADDPGGANTAPGASFAVEGLSALDADADGLAGQVIFPSPGNGAELREDWIDAALGMPRDLNGDGVIDTANHSTNYLLLPVRVRVDWRSASGPAAIELRTMLANY